MPFLEIPRNRYMWNVTAHAAAVPVLTIPCRRAASITRYAVEIDPNRCEEILALAAAQDIFVGDDEAAETAASFLERGM